MSSATVWSCRSRGTELQDTGKGKAKGEEGGEKVKDPSESAKIDECLMRQLICVMNQCVK
jgi:hypothetical protein